MSVINTNIKSLQAQDVLNINNRNLSTAMQRLSTGSRINSASDDAAGLAISTRMDSQVRGLNMAIRNANDAISVTQTAEGAIDEVTNILQRMRELSVQSANDTNSAEDRKFLNLEVAQLSQEIDRIANTTQFNGINVLDGTFKDKIFQIGANRGQTMGLNIGSMNAKVLGVASGTTDGSTTTTSTTSAVGGAAAAGTAPTKTVVNMEFLANGTTTGTYGFTLTDSITGIATTVNAQTVDMTNEVSKAAFAEAVNEALQDARSNTSVTGTAKPSAAGTVNLNDPANYSKVKFSISVDGGETKEIDLTSRLMSTANVDAGSVTEAQIKTAMNTELQLAFDSNITASVTTTNFIKVEDEQGRRIEISQGGGNGYLFGTDTANGGSLLARASQDNPISVNWDGDNLVVTNDLGGKIAVSGYSASAGNQVIFNIVDDAQIDSMNVNEPILLATAGATAVSMPTATYVGKTESSEIAIRFSDLTGTGASAQYSFKLTNGDGDVYADLTSAGGLDVFKDKSPADVISAVKTAIASGISSNFTADKSFNANEFDVSFNGDTLVIKNNSGRALAVEDFTSSDGYINVTPMNELGASEVLSSKNAHTSETRIKVNTGAFGSSFAAMNYQVSVDGLQASADLAVTLATADLANGTALAAALETAISAAGVHVLASNGSVTAAMQTMDNIDVSWDADNGELVIRDTMGRSVGFGYGSANTLAGTGQLLLQDYTTGLANKGMDIRADSATAQGDVYEATRVEMTFNADDTKVNFSVNGTSLTSSGNYVTWDASENFQNSAMKTALDGMMTSLNANHPNNVFEYAVSGRTITFLQRDGGELNVSDFKTPSTHKDVTATVTPAQGQGDAVSLKFELQTIAQSGTANGTMGVATEATLNLEGDDVYSMVVSDGSKSYRLGNTAVDISDAHSTEAFVRSLEKSLAGSNINVTMDTDGNVNFKRTDGGQVILQEFTSATGKTGTWSPKSGQGDSLSLDGSGAVAGAEVTSTGGSTTVAGGTSVAQISIATQDSAAKALDVIDKAISYVNQERSKLGAVQNRLTHTIDNLSNVVTNTSASRSRIKDTDYAATTAELARTQIIQQAATAMLAQANQAPQSVLSLLK